MSAGISDKITETFNGQNPTSTTVSGSRAIGGTTLTCTSLAGWPIATAVHFATYKKDSTGAKIAGSQTDWKGIVSGSSINTLTRQGGAADGGNGVGDIVEMMPTYAWANDLAKGLENTVNADGTLKTGLSPTFNNVTATGNETVGGTLGVTGAATLASLILNGSLTGTGLGAQVQTQANAGTGGGTIYYLNLAGVKLCWGTTAAQTNAFSFASTSQYTVTLPTSFFSTVQYFSAAPTNTSGATGVMVIPNTCTTTTLTIWFEQNTTTGGSTNAATFFVIGT